MKRSAVISTAVALLGGAATLAQNIGPGTSVQPYVLPSIPQASTTSILTVADPVFPSVNGYRMVGIPDGLGAFFAEGQTNEFTLLMNHELGANQGAVRAHGSTGAFVSRWTIDKNTLAVTSGRDHNTSASDVNLWAGSGYVQGTTAYGRLCSADLASPGAFKFGNLGTDARIFMNGEEVATNGRAFAHVVGGSASNTSWQLPRLGRYSWENAVPSPHAQLKTVVIGLDDTNNGQVYAYVGSKTDSGNDIERAGLTNGKKYGIKVPNYFTESVGTPLPANSTFELVEVGPNGDVSGLSGAELESASNAAGVTRWMRPEDGAWDPRPGKQNDFYWVNTSTSTGNGGRSRLYRLRFNDVTQPELGGQVEMLLDGTEGGEMLDNLCIDSHGRILIQEDPGSDARLSKIWMYHVDTGNFVEVAAHNPNFFQPGAPSFLTMNEESSGIIDAKDILGDGWFLLDSQAHYGIPGELVAGGQLLAMYLDPTFVPEPVSLALLILGGLAMFRRR